MGIDKHGKHGNDYLTWKKKHGKRNMGKEYNMENLFHKQQRGCCLWNDTREVE